MKVILRALVGLAVCGALFAGAPTVWAHGDGNTCTGGTLANGTYDGLTIAGFCSLPDTGVVTIRDGLTIGQGATFNAITHGTLNVTGGIRVESGGSLLLGCSPAIGCDVTTVDHVTGGIWANEAASLIIHSAIISGGLSVHGGGGGVACSDIDPILSQVLGFPSPPYATFEDNTIRGGATVSGYQSCWFGFIRNDVRGDVVLRHNTLADPDAMEVVTNTIHGDLACWDNSPAPQIGDSGGTINQVTGEKTGQCKAL